MADTLTMSGLAFMTQDDDVNRLYSDVAGLRGRLDSLSATVTREVALAQERRPAADRQIAELKELAKQNTRDIADIKASIRDLTTVVRVVRWGGAAVVATGGAGVAMLGGWWEEIRQMFR